MADGASVVATRDPHKNIKMTQGSYLPSGLVAEDLFRQGMPSLSVVLLDGFLQPGEDVWNGGNDPIPVRDQRRA